MGCMKGNRCRNLSVALKHMKEMGIEVIRVVGVVVE